MLAGIGAVLIITNPEDPAQFGRVPGNGPGFSIRSAMPCRRDPWAGASRIDLRKMLLEEFATG